MVMDRTDASTADLAISYFSDIAGREADFVDAKLEAVASQTLVFRQQTLVALDGSYVPPATEQDRYILRPGGGLFTRFDESTTSSFFPSRVSIGPEEMSKVLRLSILDPLMISINDSNPDISAVYFNSFESYNRMYPPIAQEQYSDDMDVSAFNFYYEADAENNPVRSNVWTEAYADPAGRGWMVSSIAPVWRNDRLEGVVGIDVTLKTIISSILNLELPWGGYAVLIDQSGKIIALPPAGVVDFNLNLFADVNPSEPVLSDTFKPDSFNINLRYDTRPLAAAMNASLAGEVELELGGERLASFATVPQTGWKLVIIAPTDNIFGAARGLRDEVENVGYAMVAVLVVFYLLFFAFLLVRARAMSKLVAEPLTEISGLIATIGRKDANPQFAGSPVLELDKLGKQLLETKHLLQSAENETERQTRIAQDALAKLRAANGEMVTFARVMSHQIRSPLSVIDSSAQIIHRKAENLAADQLRSRAARLRSNVAAIADLLSSLVARIDTMADDLAVTHDAQLSYLRSEVVRLAAEMMAPDKFVMTVADDDSTMINSAGTLIAALREIIGYAVLHSEKDWPIQLGITSGESHASVTIAYRGSDEMAASLLSASGTDEDRERFTPEGLGFNFFLARKAVEDNGGKIEVASTDHTSLVTVTVPRERKPENEKRNE